MSYKLPASQIRKRATTPQSNASNTEKSEQNKNALTEKQKDKVLDIAGDVAVGVVDVVKGLVEISKIRANSKAAVDKIEAETRKIQTTLDANIRILQERNKGIQDRSVFVRGLVQDILKGIPDHDNVSRRVALEQLPEMIEKSLAQL